MNFLLFPLVTLLVVAVVFTEKCDALKTMQEWLDYYKADKHIVHAKNFNLLVKHGAFIPHEDGYYDVDEKVLHSLIRQHPKPKTMISVHESKLPPALKPYAYTDHDGARASEGYKLVNWDWYKKEVAGLEEDRAKQKWRNLKRSNNEDRRGKQESEKQRLAAINEREAAREKRFNEIFREATTTTGDSGMKKNEGLERVSAPAMGSAQSRIGSLETDAIQRVNASTNTRGAERVQDLGTERPDHIAIDIPDSDEVGPDGEASGKRFKSCETTKSPAI